MTDEKQLISFVIPVYNEEDSLRPLIERIYSAMSDKPYMFEVIFINDGSTDDSKKVIDDIKNVNGNIRSVEFKKNFGKAAALNKGFKIAQGDYIISMDSDLQDNPEEIDKLMNKINEGYDLVTGWKKNRKDPLEKRLASKFFNLLTSLATGLKIHDFNCGFKAYKREVVNEIELYGEMHRYIPAIAYWKGFSVAEVEVKHSPREFGNSKYGIKRYLHGFFDFVTILFLLKFMSKPMHFFGLLGIASSIIGFFICFYLFILWLLGEVIGDRPLLMLGVLLIILGFQFISTGLIGELLIYLSKKKSFSSRP